MRLDTDIIKSKVYWAFPALSHRNFRLFWTGQSVSLIGTWMQNIGQSWLVLQLTQSAFKLGIVNAVQFLPMMVLSLFAGTVVDKVSKRKVLLLTQSSLAVLALVLASLTYFGVVQYWHVLLLALLLGAVNTLDMPTRQSFFVELVGKEDLMNAIALNSSIFNLARILGPAIAGLFIGIFGIAVCFYLNALSFVAVIVGLWLIDTRQLFSSPPNPGMGKNTLGSLKEGLHYVLSKPIICMPLALLGLESTFAMNFNVLIPTLAQQNFRQNALGYGLLMTSMGIGSLVGALSLAASSRTGPKLWALFGGAFFMSAFLSALGFEKNYYLACLTLLIVGFCSIIFTASVNTVIQLNSDDHMRGRVMSIYSLVFVGVTPIGSLFSGRVAEAVGAPACLTLSGAIGMASSVAVAAAFKVRSNPI